MHIITSAPQIAGLSPVNQLRLVAAAEEVAPVPVPPVKSLCVGAQQPFHSCCKVELRRLDHQMKMLAHQAISMHLPSSLRTGRLLETLEEVNRDSGAKSRPKNSVKNYMSYKSRGLNYVRG